MSTHVSCLQCSWHHNLLPHLHGPPGWLPTSSLPAAHPLWHTCSWNFTPAPGWTKEEAQTLKLCLMKHGVGRWMQILETGLLPGAWRQCGVCGKMRPEQGYARLTIAASRGHQSRCGGSNTCRPSCRGQAHPAKYCMLPFLLQVSSSSS